MRPLLALLLAVAAMAAEYAAPAGIRPALRKRSGESILPGGRIIAPLGHQYITGPGPFGLAISPNGRTVVSANGGPDRYSLTVLEYGKTPPAEVRHLPAPRRRKEEPHDEDEWHSVFMGLAFAGERSLYASEGNSGRVRLVDLNSGSRRRVYELNQGGYNDSYSGDLAFDAERAVLYVVDQANFRLVAIDTKRHQVISSLRLGRLPFALALSPDRRKLYVTNIGMFEYRALAGADPKRARETGLAFPAFGFPSKEALEGVRRETGGGTSIAVPGLGDPNARESNSVAVVDVSDAAAPKLEAFVRTGLPFGEKSRGGSSPSGVVAAAGRVFVANGHNDSVTVIDAATNAIAAEIPIRIPGLEDYRGILPVGLAFHEPTGWLLVAEAGINAVGVIDTRAMRVIGHVPAALFPARVLVDRDTVYVANARGHGTGPNVQRDPLGGDTFLGTIRRGSISVFPLPSAAEVAGHTETVLRANGFRPQPSEPAALPAAIRHVVLIVKENRTYDEVFGDIFKVSSGAVVGFPPLARFGRKGFAAGYGRLSVKDVNVAPNHREMALRWSFSDNFYADSDVSVDGHHWLVGSYPNAWTQSSLMAAYGGEKDFRLPTTAPGRLAFPQSNSSVHPEEQLEGGAIWHHLERNGIAFRNFGEGFELAGVAEDAGEKPTGARYLTNVPMPDPLYRNTSRQYPQFNMNIPDQYRATQFIGEVEERYVKGGEPFPRFVFIHLPNDHLARPRPEDGYPFEASFMADNDYALGRIVEYLSKSPWWREMAIFITEDDAQGGRDHIDAHRTILMGVGPHFKRNYVSHVNASFPGLLKTIFRLLGLPPLNLFDAAASDLSDLFTDRPDFAPYRVMPVDSRIFDPAKARDPLDPKPGPKLDDPAFVREQHR